MYEFMCDEEDVSHSAPYSEKAFSCRQFYYVAFSLVPTKLMNRLDGNIFFL